MVEGFASNKKLWLIIIVVSLLVIFSILFGSNWYLNYRQHSNRPQSHMFKGQVLKLLPDKSLIVKGAHINDAYPDQSDYAHPQLITVKVTPDTKFVKTLLHLLTQTELAKTNGRYDPKDLKRETQIGSEDDLMSKQSQGITVKTKDSTYIEDKLITAEEIDYIVPIYTK